MHTFGLRTFGFRPPLSSVMSLFGASEYISRAGANVVGRYPAVDVQVIDATKPTALYLWWWRHTLLHLLPHPRLTRLTKTAVKRNPKNQSSHRIRSGLLWNEVRSVISRFTGCSAKNLPKERRDLRNYILSGHVTFPNSKQIPTCAELIDGDGI